MSEGGKLIAVVGPTATGKSALALELAEHLDGEIISADAMQLYRGMDIGTAKVPPELRRDIVHHQIDVLDPREEAAVAAYQERARADIEAAWARGKAAILAGGSGLYVRAVLDVIDFPGTDPEVRAAWDARAEARGTQAVFAELEARDPEAARRIDPGNRRRIVRALEVIELTGRPFSASLPSYEAWRPTLHIGLDLADSVVDQVIGRRVNAMMREGLLAEVEVLDGNGLREGRTASRAIGYAQGLAVLDGTMTEDEMAESMALATRQLARRQRKWFRRDPRISWFDAHEPELVARVMGLVG